MPTRCCVPGCSNSGGHKFPTDPKMKMKWRVAVKRTDQKTKGLWKPGQNDIVCHQHFILTDYRETLLGERGRLKDDAIPSVFNFNKLNPTEESPRSKRMKSRKKDDEQSEPDCNLYQGVQYEMEIPYTITKPEDADEEMAEEINPKHEGVQCEILGQYSIENYRNNPKAVSYYTGFDNYEHFMFFFHCLGPAAFDLSYKCTSLHPTDQLFLTLMKLRQAKEDLELSFFFNVSESTVSRITTTWINFLYFQLKELNIWPSREIVDEYMPSDFKAKFPSTRVTLDATEVTVQKPSDVNAQSITWSSYKHRNTVKTMIGCTPKGSISYISDTYGGSASDRQIIEHSELLDSKSELFNSGDSIMADRGIMVQDLFANHDVMVNTPTMLKGKSQLEPEEVVRDRRVASKRIHIERIIGLSKRYKIIKNELSSSKLTLSNRIIYVCFAILNFRNCIVDKFA